MIRYIKNITHKIFPKPYLFLAYFNNELLKEYKECKINNQCEVSVIRYLNDYIFYGVTPIEFNLLGFKKLNKKGKSEYITMRRNRSLDKLFNDSESNKILWEKDKFNNYFSEFISRKWLYINSSTTEEQLNTFYESLNGRSFIIKPNDLYYGLGIRICSEYTDLQSLTSQAGGGGYVVEEVITNDSSIKQLNPTSLNTIRVVTCIDQSGTPHILAAILRTGNKGSVIDNARGGGSFYHIDIDTGVIDTKGRDSLGNYYTNHPSSNIKMVGFNIPRFDNLKEYAKKLALNIRDSRYVGWDIAITNNGFEVIEGNVCPSAELIQCDGTGLLPKILSYL